MQPRPDEQVVVGREGEQRDEAQQDPPARSARFDATAAPADAFPLRRAQDPRSASPMRSSPITSIDLHAREPRCGVGAALGSATMNESSTIAIALHRAARDSARVSLLRAATPGLHGRRTIAARRRGCSVASVVPRSRRCALRRARRAPKNAGGAQRPLMSMRMNRRETLSRVGLLAAAIAVALAAAEGIARLFDPGFQVVFRESIAFSDDPLLVYELRPGARDGAHRISSAGLRDDETLARQAAPHLSDRRDRRFDHPWQWRPASRTPIRTSSSSFSRARATGTRFEVLNLGVPGYNIGAGRRAAPRARPALPADASSMATRSTTRRRSASKRKRCARCAKRWSAATSRARGTLGRWLAHSRLFQLTRQWSLRRSSLAALRAQMPNDPGLRSRAQRGSSRYFRAIHEEGESDARDSTRARRARGAGA